MLTRWFHITKLILLFALPYFLFFVSLDSLETKQSICLIKNISGIECWGCGITKAIIAVLQLDFIRAYNYNKLIIIVFPLMSYLWAKNILLCVKNLIQSK